MQKITPFLWFDHNAEEAVNFYTSAFKNSKIQSTTRYGKAAAEVSGISKGTIMTVSFQLQGQEFVALNGGPVFRFTPAISFFVQCKDRAEIDALWEKFSKKGKILMEIAEYPFSERFGWLEDSFGISWQFTLTTGIQKIITFLMFVEDQYGKANEAIRFYISLFKNSNIQSIALYGAGEAESEGTVQHASFLLDGEEFMALDSNREHSFTFSPAISFQINCNTQEEVDHFWNGLTEGGGQEQCGWLKDKYGVSWQVVPIVLNEMIEDKDSARSERVMKAMLKMKKLDIPTLKKAYNEPEVKR